MKCLSWMRGVGVATATVGVLALSAPAPCAWAAKTDEFDGSADGLLRILLIIVLALVVCVGIGATTLLLRVILPGVARAADASLARLSGKRLLLAGILPLVGAALLARGVELTGSQAAGGIYAVLVGLPIALAVIVGAMAALPHLGRQVMKADSDAAPLLRASVGGLVAGLAMLSWALPPLGVLVSVLLAGWFTGIGLGAVVRAPVPAAPAGADEPGE